MRRDIHAYKEGLAQRLGFEQLSEHNFESARRLDGIGCNPAVVIGTREDFMKRMGEARSMNLLPFPEKNGPVVWPQYTFRDALALEAKQEECSRSVSKDSLKWRESTS
jgi:hypothetical protein